MEWLERLDTLLKVVWCWSHRSKQNLFVSEKRYDKLSLAFPIPNLHALHYQYVINDKFILNFFFLIIFQERKLCWPQCSIHVMLWTSEDSTCNNYVYEINKTRYYFVISGVSEPTVIRHNILLQCTPLQDCPEDRLDFRALQCQEHSQGGSVQYVPADDGELQ